MASISCAFPKCLNSEGAGFRMFKFPKNDARNRIWSEFVGQSHANFHSYHSKYLCEAHFDPLCMVFDPMCKNSNPTIRDKKTSLQEKPKEPQKPMKKYTFFMPIRGNPFDQMFATPATTSSEGEHRCSIECIKQEDPIMDHSYSRNPKKYIKQLSNLRISIPELQIQQPESDHNIDLDCDFNEGESDSDQSDYFDYSKLPPESDALLHRIDILEEKNEILKVKNAALTKRLRKLELENLQLRKDKENHMHHSQKIQMNTVAKPHRESFLKKAPISS